MNRLICVGELRAVAIKHLVELSVEHDYFATFFLREKLVMVGLGIGVGGNMDQRAHSEDCLPHVY